MFKATVATRGCWWSSKLLLRVLAGIALLAFSPAGAKGDFLRNWVGNNNMSFPEGFPAIGQVDGTVSFAVLNRTGGTTGDTWGTGFSGFDNRFSPGVNLPPLDTGARFLYLYQVVNNGAEPSPFNSLAVSLVTENINITSWGHFIGLGFQDDAGEVSATNDFGTSGTFGFPTPPTIGVNNPGIVDLTGSSDPALAPNTVRRFSQSIKSTWDDELLQSQRSVLTGLTSDLGPAFEIATLRDGGLPAAGDIPTPTPEPSALVMGCVAAPLGLLLARRRKRLATQV